MAKKIISEEAMDIIRKYPELEKRVNEYIETVAEEKETHLNIDALKVMDAHEDVKPLENLFAVSAGADGVPAEVMSVLKKYPEFEEKVNAFMKKASAEKESHLRIDALNVLEAHEDVEAVKLEVADEAASGLMDIISKYPEAEKELKEYVESVKKQREMHVSVDALKVFEK